MDLERLVVTMLGLGLIVAVNLFFFARPRGGRLPGKPGRPAGKSGPEPADGPPGAGSRTDPPGLTLPGHAPPAAVPSSKQP